MSESGEQGEAADVTPRSLAPALGRDPETPLTATTSPLPHDGVVPVAAHELLTEHELSAMKPSELQKRAARSGVDSATLDTALDADDPKAALVQLLLDRAAAFHSGATAELKQVLDADDEAAFRAALLAPEGFHRLLGLFEQIDVSVADLQGATSGLSTVLAAACEHPGVNKAHQLAELGVTATAARQWVLRIMRTVAEERERGPKGLEQLDDLGQLASWYWKIGETNEARRLMEVVIEGKEAEAALGKDHESTLRTKGNLAVLLTDVGSQVEAQQLYREVIEGKTQTLGASHRSTILSKGNLALLLHDMNAHDEARKLYEDVIALQEAAGAEAGTGDEEDTLLNKGNLANLLVEMGEQSKALELYQQVVAAKTAHPELGAEHESTLRTKNNLATLLLDMGRNVPALELYEEVAAQRKTRLGEAHRDTLLSEALLASLHVRMGGDETVAGDSPRKEGDYLDRARALLEGVVRGQVMHPQLGPDHAETLESKSALAELHAQLGETREARLLFEEIIASQEANPALGRSHEQTRATKQKLAGLLMVILQSSPASMMTPKMSPATATAARGGGSSSASRSRSISSGDFGIAQASPASARRPEPPALPRSLPNRSLEDGSAYDAAPAVSTPTAQQISAPLPSGLGLGAVHQTTPPPPAADRSSGANARSPRAAAALLREGEGDPEQRQEPAAAEAPTAADSAGIEQGYKAGDSSSHRVVATAAAAGRNTQAAAGAGAGATAKELRDEFVQANSHRQSGQFDAALQKYRYGKRPSCAIVYYKFILFYQDRLGTNTGKLEKRGVRFLQQGCDPAADHGAGGGA